MTLRDIFLDPIVFTDLLEFHPERWLLENPELELISQAYVPFGREGRGCIGIK